MKEVTGRVTNIQGNQPGPWSRDSEFAYRVGNVTVVLEDDDGMQVGYLALRVDDVRAYQIGDVVPVTYGPPQRSGNSEQV